MKLAGRIKQAVQEAPTPRNGSPGLEVSEIKFENVTLTNRSILRAKIESTAPLIMCQFSAEAQAEMLAKQMGAVKSKKLPKDPDKLFREALHVIGERPLTNEAAMTCRLGLPASAFRHAMVRAAKMIDMAMTDARASIFVKATHGYLVEIKHEGLVRRQDWVRNDGGTADIRFRGEITHWEADLEIVYYRTMVNATNVVNMLGIAGETNGIGNWRPEKMGTFGTFRIVSAVASEPKVTS